MVTYIKCGDVFNFNDVKNFAHGCNCAGAMGKGIAIQFKERFPEMYIEYKNLCKNKIFMPGGVFMYKYEDGYVFNLGTQATWKTKATTIAIETSFLKMLKMASENEIHDIVLPRIGAGLGGLNWSEVKLIIEKTSIQFPKINLFVIESYSTSAN